MKKEKKFKFDSYTAVGIAEGFEPADSEEEVLAAWQYLVDTGMVWRLQGSFGRTAMDLIEQGLITLGKVGHRDYYGNYVPSKDEVEPGTKGSEEYKQSKTKQ